EKRDVVANRERLGVRNSEGERLGQLAHRPYTAILTILLLENVLLRRGKQPQSLLRRTGAPPRPIQPVEETTAHLVLLMHQGDGLVLIERRTARPAALSVRGEGGLQFVCKAQVIHHQTAR